ncbi:MAG: hypothetical protein LBV43_09660 [Prevotella sp.]|jgi:hypothetical protein|nr:hypothetical protein [Prevotella sp.]
MKDKKMTALIVVIILLLIGLSFAKSRTPQPVDWSPVFFNNKTTPYGTYITYDLLGDIFQKENIRVTRVPIYNNLKKVNGEYLYYPDEDNVYSSDDSGYSDTYEYDDEDYDEDTTDNLEVNIESDTLLTNYNQTEWYYDLENIKDTTSYIFINQRFSLDKLDLEYLLDFVGLGNNVFISAENLDYQLMDTLKINRHTLYYKNESDTVYTLSDFPDKKYRIGNIYRGLTLNADSCPYPVQPLARNNDGDTVFIDLQYGKGHFFLHTIPTAFSNINMLKPEKYDFGFRCLSYLPQNSKIIWDEYQKQGIRGEDNRLRVLLDNPPLRTGLYIILAGFLLFMIFRAKRTQRIIPVIKPLVNSSLEFLGTISNLYYRKKDYKTIGEKRQAYFLDFIRKHYYMSTENIDDEFLAVLSAKSGMEKEKLSELFYLYKDISILPYISNEMFLKYNSLLEEFYRNVKNK